MKKFIKNADWIVLLVSLALFIIGCFALYSATQTTELQEFKKQIMWFVISIPFLILVIAIDYNLIVKFSPLLYVIGIGLLIGV
jgi:rod shape determining protein RodA